METELDPDHQQRILKSYLGLFWASDLDEETLGTFQEKMPDLRPTLFVSSSERRCMAFGAYCLLAFGRQQHRTVTAYDLVGILLSKHEEDAGFPSMIHGFREDLLIIYHPRITTHNKRTEELILHAVEHRRFAGKTTIVISERDLRDVKDDFSGRIITDKSSSVSATPNRTDNADINRGVM